MPTPESRVAFVSGARLPGWVERFAASHGTLTEEEPDGGLQLSAADGAVALLQAPWPADGRPGTGTDAVSRLASLAAQSRTLGLVLVRRGGYSVAVVRDGAALAAKTGTRHVQSRTAAGGWSQQRFARRRANQADALVEAVAEHAAPDLRRPPDRVPGAWRRPHAGGAGSRRTRSETTYRGWHLGPGCRFLDVPDPRASGPEAGSRPDSCSVRYPW